MQIEKKENRVKRFGVIIGIVSLAAQHGIYLLANAIAKLIGTTPYLPKIPAIDDAIPIVAAFIIPYVWAYVYWGMAPMAVSKCKFEHFLNYLASYLLACLFGAIVLIIAPTYMDRVAEGLMSTTGSGFLDDLMRFWYSLDGGDIAYNLLPSFHCINSTISYLGVCGRKEIPLWFRIYSLVITILIFFATLYVKQHYFLDVITGVAIGVAAYIVSVKFNLGRIFNKPIELYRKLTGHDKAAISAE